MCWRTCQAVNTVDALSRRRSGQLYRLNVTDDSTVVSVLQRWDLSIVLLGTSRELSPRISMDLCDVMFRELFARILHARITRYLTLRGMTTQLPRVRLAHQAACQAERWFRRSPGAYYPLLLTRLVARQCRTQNSFHLTTLFRRAGTAESESWRARRINVITHKLYSTWTEQCVARITFEAPVQPAHSSLRRLRPLNISKRFVSFPS